MDDFKITMAAARVNAGLTQGELAQKMGVSRFTIINWETGKVRIKPPYLHLLCEICNIPEDYIFLP